MINLPKLQNSIGYDRLKSFQLGGAINMNEDKKKELFPYFAYVYSQKLNPEKYGTATSLEEWTALIQDNPEDIDVITEAAGQLSNDDWEAVAQQYEEAQAGEKGGLTKEPQMAAKGAKLQKLKDQKKTKMMIGGGKAIELSGPTITPKPKGMTTGANVLSGPTIYGKKKIVNTPPAPVKKATQPTEKYATSKPIQSRTELNYDGTYKNTGNSKTITPTAIEAKGGKVKSKLVPKGGKKKCTCGCEMIKSKAAGGKVIETCACKCGGKMKKKK